MSANEIRKYIKIVEAKNSEEVLTGLKTKDPESIQFAQSVGIPPAVIDKFSQIEQELEHIDDEQIIEQVRKIEDILRTYIEKAKNPELSRRQLFSAPVKFASFLSNLDSLLKIMKTLPKSKLEIKKKKSNKNLRQFDLVNTTGAESDTGEWTESDKYAQINTFILDEKYEDDDSPKYTTKKNILDGIEIYKVHYESNPEIDMDKVLSLVFKNEFENMWDDQEGQANSAWLSSTVNRLGQRYQLDPKSIMDSKYMTQFIRRAEENDDEIPFDDNEYKD